MVFSVSRDKEAALKAKMASLGIKEADLEENRKDKASEAKAFQKSQRENAQV